MLNGSVDVSDTPPASAKGLAVGRCAGCTAARALSTRSWSPTNGNKHAGGGGGGVSTGLTAADSVALAANGVAVDAVSVDVEVAAVDVDVAAAAGHAATAHSLVLCSEFASASGIIPGATAAGSSGKMTMPS